MSAFEYPSGPRRRKHGPIGYARYKSFRPWLRDEYCFRCIYCLIREQWGRVIGEFDIDHFLPQMTDPDKAVEYDNLVYSCVRCNLTKSAAKIPDPMSALTADQIRLQPDGSLEWSSVIAESIIRKLDLNSPEMIKWRLLWIRIVELAGEYDTNLHDRLMGLPDDLPNMARLKPPKGNCRPDGITDSFFANAARGESPPNC